MIEFIGLDVPDNLDWDVVGFIDGIGKGFTLDINGVVEAVDFDLEVVFMEGDGVVEGAEAEDGVGLDLGDGDCIAEDEGIGGF
jgi:hypothetical protein